MILMSAVPEAVAYPMWALVAVLLLNAFKGYLPWLSEISGVKRCEQKCNVLKQEINGLKQDNDLLRKDYNEVNAKYLMLLGAMSVIKSKLKEMGYDDIPDLEKK